jgi:hypothetical protein
MDSLPGLANKRCPIAEFYRFLQNRLFK